jgi:hypothetical protein
MIAQQDGLAAVYGGNSSTGEADERAAWRTTEGNDCRG